MLFNGKTPSLNQIRYFVTVAKHLNFRRAANILGISQPTLTSQISALENTLGLILFERSRSGTLLSAQGKSLLEYAEAVLQSTMQLAARSLLHWMSWRRRRAALRKPSVSAAVRTAVSMLRRRCRRCRLRQCHHICEASLSL